MQTYTGTSSKTVVVLPDGHYTVEPPPVCVDCKTPMQPLAWLCGGCGATT